MKIRELLQIEIWSKSTSRKIFIGFAITIAGFVTWLFVDQHWLTSKEREAARGALRLVDSLQTQFSTDTQKDFDEKKQKAQQAVDVAKQVALTSQDEQVATALFWCLGAVEIEQGQSKIDGMIEQKHLVLRDRNPEVDARSGYAMQELERLISASLHKTLDK